MSDSIRQYHREYQRKYIQDKSVKNKRKKYQEKFDEEHKEERITYNKNYYEKSKGDKFICPCGSKFLGRNQKKHEQTKKHKLYVLEKDISVPIQNQRECIENNSKSNDESDSESEESSSESEESISDDYFKNDLEESPIKPRKRTSLDDYIDSLRPDDPERRELRRKYQERENDKKRGR